MIDSPRKSLFKVFQIEGFLGFFSSPIFVSHTVIPQVAKMEIVTSKLGETILFLDLFQPSLRCLDSSY